MVATDIEECEFYHVMDRPDGGVWGGQWDLRSDVDEYLGHFGLQGKRVVDLGTPSGCLCLEMGRRGADVVAYDSGILFLLHSTTTRVTGPNGASILRASRRRSGMSMRHTTPTPRQSMDRGMMFLARLARQTCIPSLLTEPRARRKPLSAPQRVAYRGIAATRRDKRTTDNKGTDS